MLSRRRELSQQTISMMTRRWTGLLLLGLLALSACVVLAHETEQDEECEANGKLPPVRFCLEYCVFLEFSGPSHLCALFCSQTDATHSDESAKKPAASGPTKKKITWDPNGYIMFCPCMGRFGNQVEYALGVMRMAQVSLV